MKIFKRIVSLLCILLCLLTLSGCEIFDDMRASRAVYKQKGDNCLIVYGGKDYRLFGYPGDNVEMVESFAQIYITEPDIPLLLIDLFGQQGYVNANKTVIGTPDGDWYVRDDVYDSFCREMEQTPAFKGLGYDVLEFTEDDDVEYKFKKFTDSQNEKLIAFLNSEPQDEYESFEYRGETEYISSLCAYSESEVFKITVGDVVKRDGEYLLIAYSLERDKFLGEDKPKYGWNYEYKITDDLLPLVKKMEKANSK